MKTTLVREGLPPNSKIFLEELGKRLRLARKRRGYSREKMAALSYVGRNTLVRMENGDPGVSVGAWAQAFHVLGMDRGWLLLLVPEEDTTGLMMEETRKKRRRNPDINGLADSL
jgi:transcriptional regulator with XRE-family HTH domain